MYRVVIIFKKEPLNPISQNFKTKAEAEDYILKESEKQDIKRADIKNLDTGEREKVF